MSEKHMIRCNACGKEQAVSTEGIQEEFLKIQKTWGYFSEKDGEVTAFHFVKHVMTGYGGSLSFRLKFLNMSRRRKTGLPVFLTWLWK